MHSALLLVKQCSSSEEAIETAKELLKWASVILVQEFAGAEGRL